MRMPPISEAGYFTGSAAPEAVFDEPTDQVFLLRRSDGSREGDIEVDYVQGELTGEWHRGQDYLSATDTRYFVATPVTDGIRVSDGGGGPLLNLHQPIYGNLPKEVSTEGLDGGWLREHYALAPADPHWENALAGKPGTPLVRLAQLARHLGRAAAVCRLLERHFHHPGL